MTEELVWLGFACVRKLVRVGQEEVGKLGRGWLGLLGNTPRLGLLGSTPRAPPSRGLSRDPARRPRWGWDARCGPSDDRVTSCLYLMMSYVGFVSSLSSSDIDYARSAATTPGQGKVWCMALIRGG
ncbi:hypothetical protein BHE74_00036068 [Ensete ventricosum]|nr:hypothetical protein BHE74_00036068 [Ensete ventricosum]RZS12730.1 hypothetical protein BHM03_00044221 [Ensete ventricosum]